MKKACYSTIIVLALILTPCSTTLTGFWSGLCQLVSSLTLAFAIADRIEQTKPPQHAHHGQQQQNSSSSDTTFSSKQAKEYAQNIIAALIHGLQPYMSPFQASNLRITIENAICRHHTTSKNKIDEIIASAVLEYIEKTAYDYALSRTYNSNVARRIAESMRNNALARINNNGYLDVEALAPFIGGSLERAVTDEINKVVPSGYTNNNYSKPSPTPKPIPKPTQNSAPKPVAPIVQQAPKPIATPQPAQQFLSEDCCVCYSSFADLEQEGIERIILVPCGHDICKSCAKDWFGKTQKNTCPQCRAEIDKTALPSFK